ncbi:hypothetical protein H4582DRAFT_2061410 [Lactarius indigo]|nr:hypothetical protein H4582DRAFT_2061410 [Lactarius indigo]
MWPPSGPPPDRVHARGSPETWKCKWQPGVEYTPPPSEPTIHLAPELLLQPHGLLGPRSPRSSIETLSLEEPPAPVYEPPGTGTWQPVQFEPTLEKTEAHPAWATWQGKLQAGLEYTLPEDPPQLFKPRSPHSSIEALPTPFHPSTRRPAHQRHIFRRARKKSEANSLAESLKTPHHWDLAVSDFDLASLLSNLAEVPTVSHGLFRPHSPRSSNEALSLEEPLALAHEPHRSGAWRCVHQRVQPGVEYTPPPSEPTIHLAPELPPQRHGLFGPRSPRSFIEGPPAPVHLQRIFRRAHKTLEAHLPGGIAETPMHTPPAQPPGLQPGLEYAPPPSEPTIHLAGMVIEEMQSSKDAPNTCPWGVWICASL